MEPLDRQRTEKSHDFANDPYQWNHLRGWRSYRVLRPCRGMYHDVKRRLPYYASDWIDGLNYHTIVATMRITFVNLLPALAFQLDMRRNTEGFFGINEALFSSALAAVVFSLLSAQPLTVVGITGLISLFNYTVYDITKAQGVVDQYPQIIAWVAIWAAITHWLAAVLNLCDYMRYITDYSSEAFGMYVGIIYMIKGVEELVAQFYEDAGQITGGYLSIVIAIGYWASVYLLEHIGKTTMFTPWVRKSLADFAYPIATLWWTGFSHIPGRITEANLMRVPRTRAFYPTVEHPGPGPWLIDFWNLDVKWIFVSLPMGILLTLLFYYDHNVSSITAQAKQFPLTKPSGFHWDYFLLGCTCFAAGIIGVPLPNGLVPQAPVHTDACTAYKEEKTIRKETDSGGEEAIVPAKIVRAVEVKEQRVSHFLMALAFIGLMTGPLLDVLHTIPRALFAGVFWTVGWGPIGGNQMTSNLVYLFREHGYNRPADARTSLLKSRILSYDATRWFGVAASVAISQTIGAIGFPVIIIALIPLRWIILTRIFTVEELDILDAPTADADVILASFGGQPERPEIALAEKRMKVCHVEEQREGSSRRGASLSSTSSSAQVQASADVQMPEQRRVVEEGALNAREAGAPSKLSTGHDRSQERKH
ncbi:hypothetical protein WHR41_09465 [Cladosporium halotolerans]|uniref:Bicarbonate transporter-like transmembrane domain-containing protein n=1 Tax=Cladosporium halotolerans TaxID=1052096 RepID=A0AB34KCM2_9PEZI